MMRRAALPLATGFCVLLAFVGAERAQSAPASQGNQIGVAVLDFTYADTAGEAQDMTTEHQKWLGSLAAGLRKDFERTGAYRVVTPVCRPEPCEVGRTPLDQLEGAAKEAGAQVLVMGGVHKESTLVQWAKVLAVNLIDNQVVADKLLTFRGDNENAWERAEEFISSDLLAAAAPLAAASGASPTPKLAVFDFELLDVSGGALLIPESAEDLEQLRLATEEARRLISQSGRYALVDVSAADAGEVKAHKLGDCDGCDAAVAAKLGADESLVAIVTRVSRTDYAVTYKLRDAHSGKLIGVEQTDLRIGANYSWPRGAAWLIENKLLAR
jgi:Fe-S cluster biogenesis protein NfuA